MNNFYDAVATWGERYLGGLVSLSSIKINVGEDGEFLSAKFAVVVRVDLQDFINRGEVPAWALPTDYHSFVLGEAVAYRLPVQLKFDRFISPLGEHPDAKFYIPSSTPIYFRRYYDIGVPFEIVPSNDQVLSPKEVADGVYRSAYRGALDYLQMYGYTENPDGEIARLELKAWKRFPIL